MVRILKILLFTLNVNFGISQSYFNKAYDISGYGDGFSTLVFESDTFYTCGYADYGTLSKLFLLKLNTNGDTIKSRTFGKDTAAYIIGFNSILKKDSNFIVIGSEITDMRRPYVSYHNNNFDTIWTSYKWNLPFGDFQDGLILNNGIVLCGSIESTLGDQNFFLLKTDFNGGIIWQKNIGNSSTWEDAYSIDSTTNGGFIISGYQDSPTNSWNIYVVKTDSLGNLLSGWPKVFSSPDSEAAWVKTLSDGNYLIYGGWQGSVSNGYAHVRKLDQNGNTIWIQNFQGPPATTVSNLFTDAIELPNGDLVFTGSFFDPQTNNPSGWIIKTDNGGNEIWRRTLRLRTNDHYLYGIVATPDGGFALSGTLWPDGGGTTQDGWIIKLDSLGCAVSGCTVSVEEELNDDYFIIYPNPSNGKFFIETNKLENSYYEILDLNGKIISSSKINNLITELELNIPNGIYFIKLENEKGIKNKKLIINN